MCALSPQRKVNDSKGQEAAGGTLSQDTPSIKRRKKEPTKWHTCERSCVIAMNIRLDHYV